MAYITSLNDYLAAPKQHISLYRADVTTSVANIPQLVHQSHGSPGLISWYKSSTSAMTTSGIASDGIFVPVLATTGNLTSFSFHSTVAARGALYDLHGYAGTYTIPANVSGITGGPISTPVTLNSLPHYNTQLWVSIVTATTGSMLSANITYTNQDGVAGRVTGVQTGTSIVGSCFRMPLQAGDTGVRSIQAVTSSAATGGAFNILILRELVITPPINIINTLTKYNLIDLGLPPVTNASALLPMVISGTTQTGRSTFEIEISG